jgi:hypothetical protein
MPGSRPTYLRYHTVKRITWFTMGEKMKIKPLIAFTAMLVLGGCAGTHTSAGAPANVNSSAASPSSSSGASSVSSPSRTSTPQPTGTAHPGVDPSTGEPVCYYILSQGSGIEVLMQVEVVGATRCYLSAFSELDPLNPGGIYLTGAWKYSAAPPANPGFEIGGCNGDVEATDANNDDSDTVWINLIGPNQGPTNNTPPVEKATVVMNNTCNQVGL